MFGFIGLSVIILYLILKHASGLFLKIVRPFLVASTIFHVACHLLMYTVTFTPIEKIKLFEKKESEKNRKVRYFGEVYTKKNELTFLQAFLVGFAPSYLSFWFFISLLDFLIHNHVNILIFILFCFIMISLVLSASPSFTDLAIIPEAFQNDTPKSLYQILLIGLSILMTMNIVNFYYLQFPHEIFVYIIIAAFYFLFKCGFKIIRYILSSINVKKHESSRQYKLKSKEFTSSKYRLSKKPRKILFKAKKMLFKTKLGKMKKDKLIEGNEVGKIEKPATQPDKKLDFKNKSLNKILTNEIVEKLLKEKSQVNTFLSKENKKIKIPHFKEKIIEHLMNLNNLIGDSQVQKKNILSKSMEILDEFISRAENNKFIIPKNANLKIIATTIIYTITVSFENIPRISRRKLAGLTNIKTHDYISKYYNRYFKHLYPKIDKRKSFEDYRKELEPIIREKKGRILRFRRKKGYVEVNLKCDCGNTWWTRPIYVIKRGTWCPKDAYKKKAEKLKKYDIHFCKELAKKIGLNRTGFKGRCLSERYENISSKLDWECGACLNEWSATLGNILYGETWCPKCIEKIGENVCRQFFEALFFAEFPKAEKGVFSWLVNDDGNYMELDGHNKKLKIAFERHGRQHYENADYFFNGDSNKFNKRLRDDQKRRELCELHNYHLIEVGFEWRDGKLHRIKFREMEEHIRQKCREKGLIIPNQERINWREFRLNNPEKLKEMQDIALSRNGRLLSKIYFNAHTKLHWYHNKCCTNWWATPTQIKGCKNRRETWCPKCGGTQKKTIEDMQKLALSRLHGGKCLSKEYKNAKSPLLWECGLCKFTFKKNSHNLNRSYYGGCPICLSIKNMKKSHIKLLNYFKSAKNVKSFQDIIIDIKYNNNKIVAIMRILERKELIEKFKYYFKDSCHHGYKISSKGLRILELYEVLKK